MYYDKDLPDNVNKQFFPAFYVTYRMGIILDPLKPGKLFPNFLKRKEKEAE